MNRVSDIDLRLLRVFVAVVEADGYTGAQTVLNVGSSTISLHMSDLEKRLGFRLCERGRSGFRLTERGQVAYEEVKALLTSLDDFSSDMAALRKRLAGRLLIGMVDCLSTHPHFPLVDAIRSFNQLDNEVHIELVVAPRAELERAVLAGHLHAAIVPYIRKISGLEFRPVLRERHQPYCGVGHPLFSRETDSIEAAEVVRHSFVLRSYHEQFDLTRFGQAVQRATVHNMEGMLVLVLSGSYIGFLPDHYALPWVEQGELRPLGLEEFAYESSHMLVTRKGARMTAAFATFLSILEDCLSQQQSHTEQPPTSGPAQQWASL